MPWRDQLAEKIREIEARDDLAIDHLHLLTVEMSPAPRNMLEACLPWIGKTNNSWFAGARPCTLVFSGFHAAIGQEDADLFFDYRPNQPFSHDGLFDSRGVPLYQEVNFEELFNSEAASL